MTWHPASADRHGRSRPLTAPCGGPILLWLTWSADGRSSPSHLPLHLLEPPPRTAADSPPGCTSASVRPPAAAMPSWDDGDGSSSGWLGVSSFPDFRVRVSFWIEYSSESEDFVFGSFWCVISGVLCHPARKGHRGEGLCSRYVRGPQFPRAGGRLPPFVSRAQPRAAEVCCIRRDEHGP